MREMKMEKQGTKSEAKGKGVNESELTALISSGCLQVPRKGKNDFDFTLTIWGCTSKMWEINPFMQMFTLSLLFIFKLMLLMNSFLSRFKHTKKNFFSVFYSVMHVSVCPGCMDVVLVTQFWHELWVPRRPEDSPGTGSGGVYGTEGWRPPSQ